MQIEGLKFLKVQKSLRAKSMNNKKKKEKISDENKGRLSNNKVFGFSMILERKCPPYEQRWRSKYGCIEQYLEDKK